MLRTVVGVDTKRGGGDLIEARSDTYTIASASVLWTGGVSSRIPSWTRDVRVATFVLVTDGDRRLTGRLWAPGGRRGHSRSKVTLRPRSSVGPTVTLVAGTRPKMNITGLPPGIRSFEIDTVAGGRSLLRFTSRCRNHLKREAWKITVRFRGGVASRTKKDSLSVSCGYSFSR
jgi:hypothetical protein